MVESSIRPEWKDEDELRKGEGGFRTSSSLLARLLAFFLIRPADMALLSSGRVDAGLTEGTAKSFDLGFVRPSSCLSLLCILEWRVSSSEREKRFSHPRKVQTNGFSPVCVRMWRVFGGRLGLMRGDLWRMGLTWCSSLLNALPHSGNGHL